MADNEERIKSILEEEFGASKKLNKKLLILLGVVIVAVVFAVFSVFLGKPTSTENAAAGLEGQEQDQAQVPPYEELQPLPDTNENQTQVDNSTQATCECDITLDVCDSDCACDTLCEQIQYNQTEQNQTEQNQTGQGCTCDTTPDACDDPTCTCDTLCI